MLKFSEKKLKKTIEKEADVSKLPKSYLLPNREEGNDCANCDCKIEKIKVSGRRPVITVLHASRNKGSATGSAHRTGIGNGIGDLQSPKKMTRIQFASPNGIGDLQSPFSFLTRLQIASPKESQCGIRRNKSLNCNFKP